MSESYVGKPFKHDIFITYSHGDADGDGIAKLKQWSEGFARELEEELKAMPDLAANIRIFRDENDQLASGLDPMAPLTEQLKEDVARSAILAILMTPQYLRSDWCKDEREWWLDQQGTADLPVDGRLAVARIWPTKDMDWPKELTDSRGHKLIGRCFYDEARAEARPQPFAWPEPKPDTSDPFRGALLDYVGDLRVHLKKLKAIIEEKERRKAEEDRLALEGGQVIYLHGRQEFEDVWTLAGAELKRAGYTVFPSEPDPVSSDPRHARRISDERVKTLSACDALMLLGTDDTRALDADLVVIGRNERHQARAFSDKLLPCAVVDKAGLAGAKPQILDNARDLGIHWIEADEGPWTRDIHPWLDGVRL